MSPLLVSVVLTHNSAKRREILFAMMSDVMHAVHRDYAKSLNPRKLEKNTNYYFQSVLCC